MASKSERSKSVPNSTSATAGVVVLVILPGCVDTLEASTFMVVPRVISAGLKGTVFVLVVESGYEGVLDGNILGVVLRVSSNSPQGRVGKTSKSERSKSVPNSTSAAAVVLVILSGCVDTLEASTFMVVPRVISAGLKGTVFVLVVGSGYEGELDRSILGVVLGVSSNSPRGRVGMTSKSERSKSVPNSISAAAEVVVLVILPGCADTLEASAFSVVPSVISSGLNVTVFVHVAGSGCVGVLDGSILWVVLGFSSNSPHGTVGLTSKSERPKSIQNSPSA
ncbi:uncharacterized protein LOC107664589 [Sinocyclocheilus anshuiensis]|uniref:uncharacterized protein LOC107664589 n=1 Tax=Sinocyclocheilus anshuiensis TaxID=1608454 RepID=UPI0007B8AC32|nr:PREDICTED: uncharacterized protein LOC107664589 [Sinocyclocheilus anshuiensis]